MATLMVAMLFCLNVWCKGKFTLYLHHYVKDKIVQFDTLNYMNELGQSYIITKFKYYIGNISFISKNGINTISKDYFLINEEDSQSKILNFNNIPAGSYTGIQFTLGVDSIDNCSGAQSGALDPANGMFWAWNTGYIFLKLEGKSPHSSSTGNMLEYHIGGYKSPYNCIRQIRLNFNLQSDFKEDKEIHLKVDIAEILKNKQVIDFSKISSVTDFHNATLIADNYVDMFSVLSIK